MRKRKSQILLLVSVSISFFGRAHSMSSHPGSFPGNFTPDPDGGFREGKEHVSLFLLCQEHFGFYCPISKTIPNRILAVPTSCCRNLDGHKPFLHGSPWSNTLGWQCLNGQTSSGWPVGLYFLARPSSLPVNVHSKCLFTVFKLRATKQLLYQPHSLKPCCFL